MRQNGPSRLASVSVLPLSPLLSRQTSDERPSEPDISTASLWVSLRVLAERDDVADAAWNSSSVSFTSRAKSCRWRTKRRHDLPEPRVGRALQLAQHRGGDVLLVLDDHGIASMSGVRASAAHNRKKRPSNFNASGVRRRSQARRTKAILARAGCRHGQANGLGGAPAVAAEAAIEGCAAARTGQLACRDGRSGGLLGALLHRATLRRYGAARHTRKAYWFGSPPRKPASFQAAPSFV